MYKSVTAIEKVKANTQELRSDNFASMRKKAFTLAEVLITLTIIGVISALTVPSLVSNVQDYAYRSAFLKNYSLIKNAYNKSIVDGEPFWNSNYSDQDNWMISPDYQKNPNLIKNYFKLQGNPVVRTNGAGPYAIGYFYRGNKNSETINNIAKYLNGKPASFMYNASAFAFQLTDGTIIGFYITSGLAWMVYVDVNGSQKPNTFGKDIYLLQGTYWKLDSNGNYSLLPWGAPGTGNAWRGTDDDCYKDSTGNSCGYKIVQNKNFKIPNKKPTK